MANGSKGRNMMSTHPVQETCWRNPGLYTKIGKVRPNKDHAGVPSTP
jgi:hypothetical protein